MTYMLMNHRNVTESVYVQYTVRYVSGEALTAVKPVWLDVRNCESDPIFNVPGDRPLFSTYTKRADFTLPEAGLLVAGGAHLHGGGLKATLTDESCRGRTLFTSEPTPVPLLAGGCWVVGRFCPKVATTASRVRELADLRGWRRAMLVRQLKDFVRVMLPGPYRYYVRRQTRG